MIPTTALEQKNPLMVKAAYKKLKASLSTRPFQTVLLVSGLIGLCLGFSNGTWQVSVEVGQDLAGLVSYPVDNPHHLYHIKVFSLVNHLSALLLVAIPSEKAVSLIVSALLGMISFQALSLLIFAINRCVAVPILGALFIYFGNYVGEEVVYPLWLLGSEHTFGVLGLSFVVLVTALFGAGANRGALFCLGLAPAVHPSLGSWFLFVLLGASLLQRDYVKKIVRRHYFYFIAGMTVALLSLMYQVYLMQDLPVMDFETKKEYLTTFINHWDLHRRRLYWNYDTQTFSFLQPGVLLCIYSIIVAILGSIYFRANESISFLFKLITVAGISCLCLGALSHFDPDVLPHYFHMFMPGRFINFSNITLAAILLGILTVSDHRGLVLNYLVSLFFLSSIFFGMGVRDASYSVILPWFAFLTLRKHARTHILLKTPKRFRSTWLYALLGREDFPASLGRPISYWKILLCVVSIFFLMNMDDRAFVRGYLVHRSDFRDHTNDAFYRKISESKGVLATTSDFFLISLKTRRPILLEPAALDALGMVPEAGEAWNKALVKVYGVDLFEPPPSCYCHRGKLFPILHRKLWETRSLKEWQEMGKEFGITGVLTRADWKLSLPVIVRDNHKVLYEVVQ